ncbi:MAG: preprotein translocase subunit SecE [Holophagales bacterium]|jgi:preprotein translocase subunit SecE|nr:MAG: preprotein translocase subunit SecE [Holophagales bacterium]
MNVLAKVKDFFGGIGQFFVDVKSEMKKVSYPSRDEVTGTTIVVLIASVIFAVYLWLADVVIVQLFKSIGS